MLTRLVALCLMAAGALDACFQTMTPSAVTVTTTAAPTTCTLPIKNVQIAPCSAPTSSTVITLSPGQTTYVTCSQSAANAGAGCTARLVTIDSNGNVNLLCEAEATTSCSSQDGVEDFSQPNIPFVCKADGSVTYGGATITNIVCDADPF